MKKTKWNPSSRFCHEEGTPIILMLLEARSDEEKKEIYEKYRSQIEWERTEYKTGLTVAAVHALKEVKKLVDKE